MIKVIMEGFLIGIFGSVIVRFMPISWILDGEENCRLTDKKIIRYNIEPPNKAYEIAENILIVFFPAVFLAVKHGLVEEFFDPVVGTAANINCFFTVLYALSITDMRYMIIPDELICAVAVLSAINLNDPLGGLLSFAVMMSIMIITSLTVKTVAVGGGDIKLIGVLGFYFGFQKAMISYFWGTVIMGIFVFPFYILKKMEPNHQVALGPFICMVAAMIV